MATTTEQTDSALKTSDVMRILNLRDARAVYRLVREGKLKAGQLGRRSYRYTRAAVDEFLAGGSVADQAAVETRAKVARVGTTRAPAPRTFART